MKQETISSLLSRMPEHFRTRAEAESRAAYLRIGTYNGSKVVKTSRGYTVLKIKEGAR